MTIEEKLEKIDEIIKDIEKSNTGLEESVEKYSEAYKLVKEAFEEYKKCGNKIVEITENLSMLKFDEEK